MLMICKLERICLMFDVRFVRCNCSGLISWRLALPKTS